VRRAIPPSSQLFPERVSTRRHITLMAHMNSQSDSSSHRKRSPLKTDMIHPRAAVFQAAALAGPRSRRLTFSRYLLFREISLTTAVFKTFRTTETYFTTPRTYPNSPQTPETTSQDALSTREGLLLHPTYQNPLKPDSQTALRMARRYNLSKNIRH
jgi:hypothetical protein